MSRVEIRCCCNPVKLLGWVEMHVPPKAGDTVILPFMVPAKEVVVDEGRPLTHQETFLRLEAGLICQPRKEKGLEALGPLAMDTHVAIKSMDTPMEKLRRVVGFEENVANKGE